MIAVMGVLAGAWSRTYPARHRGTGRGVRGYQGEHRSGGWWS